LDLKQEIMMVVRLNAEFDFAKELIVREHFVSDERDACGEHRSSAQAENPLVVTHGLRQYAKWYLGINNEKPAETKGHYEFPYGDFENVHRCGVLTAESRAGQYKHVDIENAAAHLHGMIDARRGDARKANKRHRVPASQSKRVQRPAAAKI
jgi:hypothetical protein